MTHRILNKATETNFEYEVVSIDINTGLFKIEQIKANNTLVRVRDEVFGENTISNRGLSTNELLGVQSQFNELRATKGWNAITFRDLSEKV